jgi:hypothetical protein
MNSVTPPAVRTTHLDASMHQHLLFASRNVWGKCITRKSKENYNTLSTNKPGTLLLRCGISVPLRWGQTLLNPHTNTQPRSLLRHNIFLAADTVGMDRRERTERLPPTTQCWSTSFCSVCYTSSPSSSESSLMKGHFRFIFQSGS